MAITSALITVKITEKARNISDHVKYIIQEQRGIITTSMG
jgi:hypothetical protein